VITPTKQPTDNLRFVIRGGGWGDIRAVWVRAAFRNGIAPAYRFATLGFRCAQRGCRQPLKGRDL
jgi:formylglycine-generating enzyme required for sulfatase activity